MATSNSTQANEDDGADAVTTADMPTDFDMVGDMVQGNDLQGDIDGIGNSDDVTNEDLKGDFDGMLGGFDADTEVAADAAGSIDDVGADFAGDFGICNDMDAAGSIEETLDGNGECDDFADSE